LSKIIPERTKELFEVQATIHNYLFEQKMQKKMVEWLDNLKAKAHIVVK
jgi:hypothetical protein